MSKWSSRKLAVALVVEALASALLLHGDIPAPIWESVTMATVVAYLGSQAWIDRKL